MKILKMKIILLLRLALALDYCFDEYLPLILGTENADTAITAVHHNDDYVNYGINTFWIFLGGYTYDDSLVEYTSTNKKRAWISSIYVNNLETGYSRTKINWFKYFKLNQQISEVVSMYRFGGALYVLLKDEVNQEYYFSVIWWTNGNTQQTFKFMNKDCTTPTKLFMQGDSMVGSDFVGRIFIAYNYDDSDLGPFFGFFIHYTPMSYQFQAYPEVYADGYIQSYFPLIYPTYTWWSEFKYFTCPSQPCRAYSLLRDSIPSQGYYVYMAGVLTTSDGQIKYFVQFYYIHYYLFWTAMFDQGIQASTVGNSYRYIDKMCHHTDTITGVWTVFLASSSLEGMDAQVFRVQHIVGSPIGGATWINSPTIFEGVQYSSSDKVLGIHCYDALNVFILIDSVSQLEVFSINFDFSVSNNMMRYQISSPFASDSNHKFSDAFYYNFFSSNDATKFLIVGNTKKFSSKTFSYTQGFLYPFDDQFFETCFTNTISQSTSTILNFVTAGQWVSYDSASYPGTFASLDANDMHNFCLKLDPLADPIDWYPSYQWPTCFQSLYPLMTSRAQCSYASVNDIQILDQSSTLTSIWTAEFPYYTKQNIQPSEIIVSLQYPFKILNSATCSSAGESFGEYFWTYQWTTTYNNGTILQNEFPFISRLSGYGDTQKVQINFQDPTKKYQGIMTVSLTAKLPNGFKQDTVTFYYDSSHDCNTTLNTLTDQGAPSNYSYTLFSSYDAEVIQVPITSSLDQSECYHQQEFTFYMLENSLWVELSVSKFKELITVIDSEKFKIQQSQSMEVFNLIGSQTMKVEAYNDYYRYIGAPFIAYYHLNIGCKVKTISSPKIADMTYLIKSGKFEIVAEDRYLQEPQCQSQYIVTSYSQLSEDVLKFEHDQDAKTFHWTIQTDDKNLQGEYIVNLEYKIQNSVQTINYKEISWTLTLKSMLWEYENSEPTFSHAQFPEQIQLYLGETWSFETGIPSSDTIQVELKVVSAKTIWSEFIGYEINESTFEVKIQVAPTSLTHYGFYEIQIKLTDNGSDDKEGLPDDFYSEIKTTVYKVMIFVKEPEQFNQVETKLETKQDLGDCGQSCVPVMHLDQVSYLGQVYFKFDRPMVVPQDYKEWSKNNTQSPLELTVIPGLLQDKSKLNFTWNVTEFQQDQMTLQIMFEYPIFISMADTKDILQIQIINRSKFIDQTSNLTIETEKFMKFLPTQMAYSEESQNFITQQEDLGQGMNQYVIFNFIFNTVLSGSLHFIWGMINCLQINFHLIGINCQLPARVWVIYSSLIAITQFQIIPESMLRYFYFWNFSHESRRRLEEDIPQFKLSYDYLETNVAHLGYESVLIIENLGTLFVLLMIYLVAIIFSQILNCLSKLCRKLDPVYQRMANTLFWSALLRFIIESYLELCISSMVNLKSINARQDTIDEKVNFTFAQVLQFLLILFPIFVLGFMFTTQENDLRQNLDIRNSYGSLFIGLKLQRRRGLYYFFAFTLRRLIFAYNLVFLDDHLIFQIIVNFALSLCMIIYLGKQKPWEIPQNNTLELFNEFLCLILQYHQLLFTDFVPDIELKAMELSSFFISLTYFIIAVNCYFVIQQFVHQIKVIKVKREKRKKYLQRMQEYEQQMQESKRLGSIYNKERSPQEQYQIDLVKAINNQVEKEVRFQFLSNPGSLSQRQKEIHQKYLAKNQLSMVDENSQEDDFTDQINGYGIRKNIFRCELNKPNMIADLIQKRQLKKIVSEKVAHGNIIVDPKDLKEPEEEIPYHISWQKPPKKKLYHQMNASQRAQLKNKKK